MEPKEKIFTLSVMSDLGDSVVQTGKVQNLKSVYYKSYDEALDAIKEQCKSFVEDENK